MDKKDEKNCKINHIQGEHFLVKRKVLTKTLKLQNCFCFQYFIMINNKLFSIFL